MTVVLFCEVGGVVVLL